MIPMDKVQRGIAMFIDRELMPSLTGWDKILVGGSAGIAVAKLPKLVEHYPIISALDIYDKDNNQMDIDTLYQSVVPYLNNEVLPLRIPVLGITMKSFSFALITLMSCTASALSRVTETIAFIGPSSKHFLILMSVIVIFCPPF